MRKNKVNKNKNNVTIGKKIADTLDVSTELMNDCVLIKLCGSSELMVENYKGIIDYSDKNISLKAKPYNLKIMGKELEIRNLTDEALYITGIITEVSFIDYDKDI